MDAHGLLQSMYVGRVVTVYGERWLIVQALGQGRSALAVRSDDPLPAAVHLIELPDEVTG